MNTPNPLVPQGTFAGKGKSIFRITVFAILAIHVVLLGVLLIAGCNRKSGTESGPDTTAVAPPAIPAADQWPGGPTSAPPIQATQDTARQTSPVISTQETFVVTPPTPPPDAVAATSEHTIAKGESFYTLGKKYNVGFKAIADANPGVNPNRLKIGEKVKIPPGKNSGTAALGGTSPIAATAADGGTKSYKVKSGDNLMKIAKTYGVTVKQLRAANNLKTDRITVGQALKIPAKSTAPALEAPPPVSAPATGFAPSTNQ